MHRNYSTGIATQERMFVGVEVEHTVFHGLKTLFLPKLFSFSEIENAIAEHNIEHLFVAANHSYSTSNSPSWIRIVELALAKGMKTTLEIKPEHWDNFNNVCSEIIKDENFCLLIGVPIPNIDPISNMYLKIDDTTFNATNPGVWVHGLDEGFTPWSEYTKDTII